VLRASVKAGRWWAKGRLNLQVQDFLDCGGFRSGACPVVSQTVRTAERSTKCQRAEHAMLGTASHPAKRGNVQVPPEKLTKESELLLTKTQSCRTAVHLQTNTRPLRSAPASLRRGC
jgi:hypothetical protein